MPSTISIPSREKLSADRNLYVATTGSNSNTGLAASAAFLTIQHAIDVAAGLDLNGHRININVADGTYAEELLLPAGIVGGPGYDFATDLNSINLVGNTTTPANVIIGNQAAVTGLATVTVLGFGWSIAGFRLLLENNGIGISATSGSLLYVGRLQLVSHSGMQFGCLSFFGSAIAFNSTLDVFGNNWGALFFNDGGTVSGSAIAINNTPAWGIALISMSTMARGVFSGGCTGSATGKRYDVITNSVLNTGGGGASYFPGDVAGTAATGGQYV
jgi:hypothetical protein